MIALLRRLIGRPRLLSPTAEYVQIPDEVLAARDATPGGSLRIYYVVVPGQQTNVVWWLDESTEGVKQ